MPSSDDEGEGDLDHLKATEPNSPNGSEILESGVRGVRRAESTEGRLRGGNWTCCSWMGDNILGKADDTLLVSECSEGCASWRNDSELNFRSAALRGAGKIFRVGSLAEDGPAVDPLIVRLHKLLLGEP